MSADTLARRYARALLASARSSGAYYSRVVGVIDPVGGGITWMSNAQREGPLRPVLPEDFMR
jgi:hypothetical protein